MNSNYTYNHDSYEILDDLDLKEAFIRTIYGSELEKGRGRWMVLQIVVRDAEGSPQRSPFTYKLTGEGKHAERGPNTTRTGYLCSEHLVKGFYRPAVRVMEDERASDVGNIPAEKDVVFLSTQHEINEHDVLVLINIDDDGNIINPVSIQQELNVTKVYKKTLDNGRPEFYALLVEDQK